MIEEGQESGDRDALRRAAHTLKSQAAVFGADAVATAVRTLAGQLR